MGVMGALRLLLPRSSSAGTPPFQTPLAACISKPPCQAVTWPEALVWLVAMLVESIMFAVLTGYIFSYILAVSAVKQEVRGRRVGARLCHP